MTTMDREPEHSLEYVAGRLDGVLEALQEVRETLLVLAHRIDQTNERIDQTNERIDRTNERIDKTNERIDKLILALFGFGGALLVTVLGGMIALGWAIVQSA
jgi:methyl-accepting chemotaxis protein